MRNPGFGLGIETLQLAKKHFNVPLTIARVNNPANVVIFKELGIDEAISATEILLNALETSVTPRA